MITEITKPFDVLHCNNVPVLFNHLSLPHGLSNPPPPTCLMVRVVQVNVAWRAGEQEKAWLSSRRASTWSRAAIFIGMMAALLMGITASLCISHLQELTHN